MLVPTDPPNCREHGRTRGPTQREVAGFGAAGASVTRRPCRARARSTSAAAMRLQAVEGATRYLCAARALQSAVRQREHSMATRWSQLRPLQELVAFAGIAPVISPRSTLRNDTACA